MIEAKAKMTLGNLDFIVYTDEKWVKFMLTQLISNSVKYRGEGLELTFEAYETQGQVVLSISDNGIGIPLQDRKRVFDKGFTGENGRRFAKSTGIGLYVCKKLCDKMHMGITLASEVGEWTTVTLSFPKDKTVYLEE